MPVRVLLLDDDLVFASEARAAFIAAGCEVEVLDDGSAAVLRASQQPPDVVIASAELPGINGFRLCTRLKRAHEGLAVVLTYADGSASGVASHQRLMSRADAYVPRTVALHELVARVRSLSKRARSEMPASSRRKTGAPSSRPRSRTPAKSPGTRSVRPGAQAAAGPVPRTAPMRLPPPPAALPAGSRAGAPRPDASGQAEREILRRNVDAGKAQHDELSRTLLAARTDADALRRALDAARVDLEKVRADAEAKTRALTSAEGEAMLLGNALAEASRERDERATEVETSRLRTARLEQQLQEADARAAPGSERLDQRLAVLQRSAESARLDREQARRELASERARVVELEATLQKEQATRAEADAKRELATAQAELMDDPATLEGRVRSAIDQARREHALEMTRLRGEHAGVVFQLRHELAVLRGTARASLIKPTPPQGTPSVRGGDLQPQDDAADRVHAEEIEVLKKKHQRELDATRSNLDVMMRRVEALEGQLGTASSGEHPVAGRAHAAGPPAPPVRKMR